MKYISSGGRIKPKGSRPARGAWIEMPVSPLGPCGPAVAPRKGRVD